MSARYLFPALLFLVPCVVSAQPVWINEFHYDDASTDTSEFVEVASPAGTDLTGYTVVLYNGNGGAMYDSFVLTRVIPDQQNGFGTDSVATPGIQNGAPDGLALVDGEGTVLQFLCYEGTFTATDGPAAGQTCTDVGVSEPESTPAGESLQLIGTGSGYGDFAWSGPADDSPGAVNAGQTFGAGDLHTTVQFASPSAAAGEGDGSVALTVTITNPSASLPTTANVVFLPASSTGTSADLDGFSSQAITFPAGSSTAQTVTVPLTDDDAIEGEETFDFALQDVAGGDNASVGTPGQLTLTLDDNDVADFVVINELDSDTPGDDAAEFVELYDGGVGETPLTGLVLILFNGGDRASYRAIGLDTLATGADGLFVVCGSTENVPGCDLDLSLTSSFLQNGPDAVALYVGSAADFPEDTPIPLASADLIDAVVYGNGDDRDDALLQAFGADGGVANVVTVQFDEDYGGAGADESLQRINLSAGAEGGSPVSALLYPFAPTPGALNPAQVTVDRTEDVANVAGWRLLSSPVALNVGVGGATGPFVEDYAAINLVQGITGEYPDADPNLYDDYLGGGTYGVPEDTDVPLPPGEGFFWYWFDEDIEPVEGGTSRSYDLINPDFHFALTGVPLDDRLIGGPVTDTEPANGDGFYLAGNPFAYPLRLGAVAVSGGTLQSNFGVWDPEAATYVTLTADFDDPYASDTLGVWNGVFAEIGTAPALRGGADPVFSYSSAYVDPTVAAPFIGRHAAAETRVHFRLDGQTDSGALVADHASLLRFRDDATLGWDRHDGSKLYPPTSAAALIAPVGERDGAPYRQAVRSLPLDAFVTMPLSFLATEGGTFTLAWDLEAVPPEWTLRLTDLVTGDEVDLREAPSYAFAAGASAWTDRFNLTVSAFPTAAEPGADLPGGYALSGVYPNPLATSARLTLRVAEAQRVTMAVYDVLGRRVALLHDGPLAAGAEHAFAVDGRHLASGTYVVRVQGEHFSDARRLTVVR